MSPWNTVESLDFRGPLAVTKAATVVLDAHGRVIGWSPAAEALLGYRADEVMGRPVEALLAKPLGGGGGLWSGDRPTPATVRSEVIEVRRGDGGTMPLAATTCSLGDGAEGPAWVLVAAELEAERKWETAQSLLRGLATQSPIGLAIYDASLRLAWANAACSEALEGPLANSVGSSPDELYPDGKVVSEGHPSSLEAVMRQVLETGEPVIDLHFRGRPPSDPDRDHIWSCSYYRLLDARGQPLGVCEDAFDITDRYRAQQRLALLVRAGGAIGTTLDVWATAREVAEVTVPEFADAVAVDLVEEVLDGEELTAETAAGQPLVRVAHRVRVDREGAHEVLHRGPSARERVEYHPSSPQARSLAYGRSLVDDAPGAADVPEVPDAHCRLVVRLRAGGATLGVVTFLRSRTPADFDRDEIGLAEELAARTAVCLDNSRRYTRERVAAITLQRSLLPRTVPEQTGVEAAFRYLPADNLSGVGGDWFDVIPLSGCRIGLVVGDVVGRGLSAAATMGRLRTTVRALALLDLPPDELLARLDDLVGQAAKDWAAVHGSAPPGTPTSGGIDADEAVGVTCLYAVYDPVSGRCTVARAGHLPPAVARPDAPVDFPDLPAGPPLGLGGLPFETTEVELPEGTLLALFTDGLVQSPDRDMAAGLERIRETLSERGDSLELLCDRALATLVPDGSPADDAALLLVRTRKLGEGQVAEWTLPADPAAVGKARSVVTRQLGEWGLAALDFTTELVVSELVTNAIRYASGPIRLRLIRDRAFLIEVSDTGHTSPHLRYAASDDEGGRGLFIVTQLVQRWGTRYTSEGKTIWTEQARPEPEEPSLGQVA
ncbi:SpoIIE family protein phosphatase [Wenjunlia tyrosinilytica]|uniref:PAS domain-containing protein n=1 Tax=Wenjunlia tyrosinilytica TaxID=1544741 RepID=A0A917ZTI4_9ACTN|nr:SpoIIE family protein phosphatase [Wenjunlia tyrosinilytica]GGO90758.1 hypothetical protein GCM10012280_37020 [Wenjunlia tyrosinilytica]